MGLIFNFQKRSSREEVYLFLSLTIYRGCCERCTNVSTIYRDYCCFILTLHKHLRQEENCLLAIRRDIIGLQWSGVPLAPFFALFAPRFRLFSPRLAFATFFLLYTIDHKMFFRYRFLHLAEPNMSRRVCQGPFSSHRFWRPHNCNNNSDNNSRKNRNLQTLTAANCSMWRWIVK